jgi:hypothetical protein
MKSTSTIAQYKKRTHSDDFNLDAALQRSAAYLETVKNSVPFIMSDEDAELEMGGMTTPMPTWRDMLAREEALKSESNTRKNEAITEVEWVEIVSGLKRLKIIDTANVNWLYISSHNYQSSILEKKWNKSTSPYFSFAYFTEAVSKICTSVSARNVVSDRKKYDLLNNYFIDTSRKIPAFKLECSNHTDEPNILVESVLRDIGSLVTGPAEVLECLIGFSKSKHVQEREIGQELGVKLLNSIRTELPDNKSA